MQASKVRIITFLSLLLIAGFLATSLVSYFVARDSLSDEIAESSLPLTGDTVYSEIQQDLVRPIIISSLMANDTFVRDWVLNGEVDKHKIEQYLTVVQKRYDAFTSFFISEKSKRYYHPSGEKRYIQENDPNDSWYFHARDMADDYEANIDADDMTAGRLTMFINHKVFDSKGTFIGITGIGLSVDSVKHMIETYRKRYGRQVYFVDREGEVKLHDSAYSGPENIRDSKSLRPFATSLLTSPSGSYVYQRDGDKVFLNSRLVPEFNWYLLVEEQEELTKSPLFRTLVGNLLGALGITSIVLVIAYLTVGGYQQRLEEMATIDHLTRAVSRQAFDLLFSQAIHSTNRHDGGVLSVIMLDIDHFKKVNDTYGHLGGDEVLRSVAESIHSQVRKVDILCRWGGEEFLLLLPDCDAEAARQLAEKIRIAVAACETHLGSAVISVTLSAGITQYTVADSEDSLIRRADVALYEAKQNGRDQVKVAT
ncbi:MAG: GGDEF domain-containing protein [Rhodospirillaceae bacterium]|jgi:diguanylate cyclase (GGDEF)-like protein|nr:GGDEF domain-containing protein [Rhodospirillaceae bacterium]MBT4218825.1 GGDEF domain-containing protein [Rhodospirillaceae bacterium]MBT4463478.1 GGDEF domain-containing protein [Rhodospirillaceae bacterium]MBT5309027.1 GGDEF domain-containing protein [Rhodospirillaceae bacterium]MBT7355120.1 GGDEF domain-containing protein [Rhodospirillaceae bacterium]